MRLAIPDFSLVVLAGASGSGKSSFAREHFRETEIVSSDRCRALVADDETDQSATRDAFEVLYAIVSRRLAARRLTVIDATMTRREDRAKAIEVARRFHALPVALVFDVAPEVAVERNKGRELRAFGARVVYDQVHQLRKNLRGLHREGFRAVYTFDDVAQIDAASVVREPLFTDRRTDRGPFDIIGDVHGCARELTLLLEKLEYRRIETDGRHAWRHPQGRRAIFVGDLVDRGPGVVEVLQLVMDMVDAGSAHCLQGNHENKLMRKLDGRPVTVSHGLAESLAQIDALPSDQHGPFIARARAFLRDLRSHYWLAGGELVVAHAGLREEMHGRGSGEVRQFALYGETTGETDEFGLPVRYDWAADYRGKAVVVYGHTPVPNAEWVNKTICVDTGCVYGGRLTALRFPELTLVDVQAERAYVDPIRPPVPAASNDRGTAQQRADQLLSIDDVAGKRRIETRWSRAITIPAENAAAALETMSRFCADPRWLIYLPPTMSPPETSAREGLLEHPDEAIAYFRRAGVRTIVAEEKHMGSRAVAILGTNADAIERRFGIADSSGIILTRTGRRFFEDAHREFEGALLERLADALTAADIWNRLQTDWIALDAELMPWSVKAQGLVDSQYAPAGEAAALDLSAFEDALRRTAERGIAIPADEIARNGARLAAVRGYARAYERYVRPVRTVDDLALAPFHVLASEGHVHDDRDHVWHMNLVHEIVRVRAPERTGVLRETRFRVVDIHDQAAVDALCAWWSELTDLGGEGIVIKPLDFISRDSRGLVQPAIKVRGPEYLRIIYGPEYTLPEHLERLRARNTSRKRQLALSEFSLGLEALHRFVERGPLRSVHECVFAVLALESEPVDPRL